MERWMGSRTARWVIVLGAALLAFRTGLTKYRLGAEETKEAPPNTTALTQPKREALRYGGKNFDQWRVEMETELKPEIRADGMTAMAAFGANGYGPEATRTIVDLMAGYDLKTSNTKDNAVVDAAYEAIRKIGKPALPLLWEGVRGDNERSRLFTIKCLTDFNGVWHPPVAEILKAARHEDQDVRQTALELLAKVENKPKSCLPVLLECVNDKDSGIIREKTICLLDAMRPEASEVMSAMRTVIADSEPWVRRRALLMAEDYGAQAKPLVPVILKRLENPDALYSGWFNGLQKFNEFETIMKTLATIGPAAKEALPKLRKMREEPIAKQNFRTAHDEVRTYRDVINETIKKIEGK